MNKDTELLPWLLDSRIPTIRYQTLVGLCRKPADDPAVRAARDAIMNEGPVPVILAGQGASGAWTGEHSYYTPKYVSTHWSLTMLVELGVDGADARFRRGVTYMLQNIETAWPWRLEDEKPGISCFWGNLLRYALHAGHESDALVQRVVAHAVTDLHARCRCEFNYDVACAWGVVRSLWGLAALTERSSDVARAIEAGLAFLLDSFSLRQVDYPLPPQGSVHTLWSKTSFPLFYQADILFTLRVLAELDTLQREGAQDALDWLEQRRLKNGRWRGGSPFRRRTWPELGDAEETRRWVSLQSALLLQQAGRLGAEMMLPDALG